MLFGSEDWPIRPSKVGKFIRCPMSVYLDSVMGRSDEGNSGAHTGSVVHKGVETFHRTVGDPLTRKEEALLAARNALGTFPSADWPKASRWITAYADDPANISADVPYIEYPVTLRIPVDENPKHDFVSSGTLDQIRRGSDGRLTVWDLKTGVYLSPSQIRDEAQPQQAVYVLGARQTLGLDIFPGGLIYAAGYDKPRGQRFLHLEVDLDHCSAILDVALQRVLDIRRGRRDFIPGASACGYCDHRAYPKCSNEFKEI